MTNHIDKNNLSKFGRVALDLKFVDIQKLEECLQIQIKFQKAGKEVPKLGRILLAKKYITSKQLKIILDKQKDSKYATASATTTDLIKAYPPNTVIFREGDTTNPNLYLIHEGTVEFYRNKTLIETKTGAGEFFGIVAFLINTPFTATAITKTAAKIFSIPCKEVNSFLYSKPEMALKVAKILAEKVYQNYTQSNNAVIHEAITQSTPPDRESDQVLELTSSNIANRSSAENPSTANTNETLAHNANTETAIIDTDTAKNTDFEEIPAISTDIIINSAATAPTIISEGCDIEELLNIIKETPDLNFSKELVNSVKAQIKNYLDIEELEKERVAIQESFEVVPDDIKSEINKQRREVTKIPPLQSLKNIRDRIYDKLNPTVPEPDEDGNTPPAPPPLDKHLRHLYEIAIQQKDFLIARAEALPEIFNKCSSVATAEPLFAVLEKYGIDSKTLFGWGVYAMGVADYGNSQIPKLNEIRKSLSDIEKNDTSLGKILKIKKNTIKDNDTYSALKEDEETRKFIQINASRELNNIEKNMVEEFWDIYKKVAPLLITEMPASDKVMLKAFLRFGLLGYTSKWIDYDRCQAILEECATPLEKPNYSMQSNYIYYADEIIELTAKGMLPPSPNEDLELNHRNSPEWRADRSYRKHIYLTMQQSTLTNILQWQEHELYTIRQKLISAQEHLDKLRGLHSKNEKTKTEINMLRQKSQKYRVQSTRLEKLIEKIRYEMLDKIKDELVTAEKNLKDSGVQITAAGIISHEVEAIRRSSRLVAKLKEPFIPFMLRDNYKPEILNTNDRKSLTEAIMKAEGLDPILFSDKLIPSAKRIHRILVRKAPIITIAPTRGVLGFVVEPRNGLENGRFVVPGYFERANMKEDILYNVLADFRFDNSKADAGVDVMNSETLVAAYSTYRWNMRKKDKENRQKAGIYMEENERTNWRRHYSLYMKSAPESGKLLFYKCVELYDAIINKFIDLPEGCELLKR